MGNNMKIEDGSVVLNINPKLYSLETVYSAAYVFLDKAYILLDGDPKKEILVKLKPKNKEDLEQLGGNFLNELINYADYQKRAEQTKEIREMLLQRALFTNDPSATSDEEFDEIIKELEDDGDLLDDSEEIAPWEEQDETKDEDKTKQ